MKALIVTPAPAGSLTGNRRTAIRWTEMLTRLQHTPQIVEEYQGEACDLMIALHAAKSADSIARFHTERPDAPLLVALTGTDLHGDLRYGGTVASSLERARRLIVLQPLAAEALAKEFRSRVRVILQSVEPVQGVPPASSDHFEVCVLGHLRPVKDPFRAAEAARKLPDASRVRVLHVGSALQPEMERRAREEQAANGRYRWLGPLPWDEALRMLARSRLLVLSSFVEGGANVVGEAVVHDTPVIATRIPGSVGLLGPDYPGYFPVGDTEALATLIRRAEIDRAFRDDLHARCRALAPAFAPERELDAWRSLLAEISPV